MHGQAIDKALGRCLVRCLYRPEEFNAQEKIPIRYAENKPIVSKGLSEKTAV
jgi:hypothetical protein